MEREPGEGRAVSVEGPKKLRAWLERHWPDPVWPVRSTLGVILERHALNGKRPVRRHRATAFGTALAHAAGPNLVYAWTWRAGSAVGMEIVAIG